MADGTLHQQVKFINTTSGINPAVNAWCDMSMDIQDTRRERLRLAIKELAGQNMTGLASRAGKSPSQISDMLSGRKSFGEKVARDLEYRLGLPVGWLDASPDGAQQGPSAHQPMTTDELAERLAAMLKAVPAGLRPAAAKLLESLASTPDDEALKESLAHVLGSSGSKERKRK